MDLSPGAYTEELLAKDVTVWIDAIDGTQAFTDGSLDQVTSMVGITVKGRPRVGIIHKPFTNERNNNLSRTYVGSTESGLFFFDHSKHDRSTSSPTYVPPFANIGEVTVGRPGHFQPQMNFGTDTEQENMKQRVFQDINKFLHSTNENSDFFMNLMPGYAMWDICASEAIFESRFGILTDARQKPLFYDSTRRSFGLYNGVVAARDAGVYLEAKSTYESKRGCTLAAQQMEIRRDIHMKN